LTANPKNIQKGESSKLTWTTDNANSVTIDQGVGSVSLDGSTYVSPTQTTTYTLTAKGDGGTVKCQTTVTVQAPPPPSCTLTANPSNIKDGQSSTLTWTTQNATSVSIDQGIGSVALNGSKSVSPHQTTTYTLTAKGDGGTVKCQTTVTVTSNPPPSCTLSANPDTITQGQSSTLTWTTDNATSATIDQGIGSVSLDGSKSVTPSQTTTYTLTATGPGGTVKCHTTVTVITPQNGCIQILKETFDPDGNKLTPVAQFTFQLDGATTTVNDANGDAMFANVSPGNHQVTEMDAGPTWKLLSVTPADGKVIVSPGPNCAGVVFKNQQVVQGKTPACSLSISPTTIRSGESATLTWSSSDVTSGFIDNGVGTTTPVSGGSVTVFPPSSTTYHGTFTGPDGTVQCSVPITVTTGCNGSCGGGGLNQPNVSLFHKPGEQPLAFVSLSQIPYTGFEAGPALTVIFWLAVGLLSAFIAYLIVGGDGFHSVFSSALSGMAGIPTPPRGGYANHAYPQYGEEHEYLGNASVQAPVRAGYTPAPVHEAHPSSYAYAPQPAAPSLHDIIESRAHAAGVLMSPEALTAAVSLSKDQGETLRIFGDVLNDAVRTIPREDGWIMLTAEAFRDLAGRRGATLSANVSNPKPSVSETTAVQFAGAVLSNDRENAFAIIRSLEHDKISPTSLMAGTATVLDTLFRSRKDGRLADPLLTEKARHLTDEKLEHLVAIFAHALDHTYASPFTGVKLALAQAFEAAA
jgi:hypothetical protein